MLPSPSSSPRVALENRTNLFRTPSHQKLSYFLPTPPGEKHPPKRRVASERRDRSTKRLKVDISADDENQESSSSDEYDESDMEMEDIASAQTRMREHTAFRQRTRTAMRNPAFHTPQNMSTTPILQSFIFSDKSDVFKCQSTNVNAYLTPVYACSYTNNAKSGGLPLLAAATEQGTVHVMNTSRRKDWDCEPPRATFQPHENGVFDVKWNAGDNLIATCSGDQSTRITSVEKETLTHILHGHTSTVKCVAWDPNHSDLLSTGGRDGTLCIWDLRIAGKKDRNGLAILDPVIRVPIAHGPPRGKGRKSKNTPAVPSLTHLAYPEVGPYGLISSGSGDGILKYWDLRQPSVSGKSRVVKPKQLQAIYCSPLDPTLQGSRRPRGISKIITGTGPTAGLIFALGADSQIHTYALPALEPQSHGYIHENMGTISFSVGMALSPCGRWMASGGTGTKGSIFLFDVSNAARPWSGGRCHAVELQGQQGEISGIDWAEGMLASGADDGTIRVWRPDIETYRSCQDKPGEDWSD